ncbi:hypothetical protein T01_42 [Trichinella spiralis]|uniref:Uncharacterized protein n=1 Tax=Trichinella spiralis TaxID=6334 RepID=A0A0V0ZPI7_TRISP|nr:hypothetical protein T01_42 [Trichinella spiralis]
MANLALLDHTLLPRLQRQYNYSTLSIVKYQSFLTIGSYHVP